MARPFGLHSQPLKFNRIKFYKTKKLIGEKYVESVKKFLIVEDGPCITCWRSGAGQEVAILNY